MSDFDRDRSWATWFHRTGRKTAQQRAEKVRKEKVAKDAGKRGSGGQGQEA